MRNGKNKFLFVKTNLFLNRILIFSKPSFNNNFQLARNTAQLFSTNSTKQTSKQTRLLLEFHSCAKLFLNH